MAHTYYMLLVLVQLKVTVFRDDDMDLIFTDACKESNIIFPRIKSTGLFRQHYYLRRSDISLPEHEKKLKKFVNLLASVYDGQKTLERAGLMNIDFRYDRFLCYVSGRIEEQIIYNEIKKKNLNAEVNLYEESYVSYYSPKGILSIENKQPGFNQIKLLPILMHIFGKKDLLIDNNISYAWCFEPDFIQYKSDFKIGRIPKLDQHSNEVIKMLNYIFEYEDIGNEFDVNKIFLEDSWYMKDKNYGDLDLISEIYRNCNDKENFLVKLHPRTINDRFKSLGIPTAKSNIPLELLVLNGENEKKLFLTIGSGAPLVCLVNFNMENKVIMLYKCCTMLVDAITDEKFIKYLEMLKHKYPDQLFIPEDKEELKEILAGIEVN